MNDHFFLPKPSELNTHFFLAMDAEWDEGKHPRADNGQFGKGSGGSMPQHAATPKETKVSSTLTGVFSKAGFKKQKQPGANNTVVYFHPESGVKVSVHPAPEGKKWSSKWTHVAEGKETQGEGSNLEKLLASAIAKAQAKAAPAEKPTVTGMQISSNPPVALKKMGYNFTGGGGSIPQTFHNPATKTTLKIGQTGVWAITVPTGGPNDQVQVVANGNTEGTLADYLNDHGTAAPEQKNQEALATNTKGFASALKDAGYKPEKHEGDQVLLSKPNGAKVLFNATTTEWVAQTPGHMTKEGKGVEKLQSLLNGKIEAGVLNTNKTANIVSAAEKEAQAKAQAEQAAKQAKAEQAQAKATAMFDSYKHAAPSATSTERSAISSYSSNGYVSMNNTLRDPQGHVTGALKDRVEAIDSYLKKASFPEDGVLYRGVKGAFAGHLKSVLMKGTKFADYGFVSTSAFEHSAFGGELRMKINVKKGQRGASIYDISGHKGEHEILLPRESMFEVVSYDRKSGYVEVNLIQDHFE